MTKFLSNILRNGLVFLLLSTQASAQVMSPREIGDMRKTVIHGCYKTQRKAQMNRTLSDTQLKNYCSCYAEELLPMNLTLQTWEAIENLYKNKKDNHQDNHQEVLNILTSNRGLDLEDITDYCASVAFD